LDAFGEEQALEHVVAIGIKIPAGVVVSEGDVGPRVCSIEERLAPSALIGVVVVAIDAFSECFGDVDPLATRINLAGISTETRAPNTGEVIVVIGGASDCGRESPGAKTENR